MKSHLLLLLTLPYIIHTRVLPYGPEEPYGPEGLNDVYGTARIDEKKAANVNQDFLNSFLGNVQSSSGDIKPITDQFKEESKFDTDKFKNEIKNTKGDGDEYEEPYEDGYDYAYGYGYDDDDDHIDSDYYKYSINCREFHFEEATSAGKCHAVELRDYDPDYDTSKPREKAYCRWDMGFAEKNKKQAGCLCPRTKNKCHKKLQCYWYKPKHSSKYDESENDGQCVHNSERFYKILANLLSKRGKKDFALKIKYSSAAAKGELPYGPFGPSYFPHHDEPYTHPIHGQGFDYDSFDKPQYGHGSFGTSRQKQSGYEDYYNDMNLHGDYIPDYGYGHGMEGYGDYHSSGYGDYSGMTGYGGHHNGMTGYGGYHNNMAGYGDPNGVIGYGGYPNNMGGYGGYPAQIDPYAGGYPNINQGGLPHEVPYNSEGYNVHPQYAYAPPQAPVSPASESLPYGHVPQNNFVENAVYPAREANSLPNPVKPSVPEYQPVTAPYHSTPTHVSGSLPFGQAPQSIPQHPVYQQSPSSTVQVKPVAPEYQAATHPRNEQVYQHLF